MMIAKSVISIAEVNQDFSKVVKLIDKAGSAVITKNNAPKYLVVELNSENLNEIETDETVAKISRKLMKANKSAYEVLAK